MDYGDGVSQEYERGVRRKIVFRTKLINIVLSYYKIVVQSASRHNRIIIRGGFIDSVAGLSHLLILTKKADIGLVCGVSTSTIVRFHTQLHTITA